MKKIILVAAATALLAACSPTEPQQTQASQTTASVADTSQNALDWQGIYTGMLPCADCSGIKTTLTLQNDGKFTLVSEYVGEADGIFNEKGTFKWNATGDKIKLSNGNQYQVGENQLFMLDGDGNQVTGPMAEFYQLEKNQ